jgi:2-methylcitrate dehydratase PrpD
VIKVGLADWAIPHGAAIVRPVDAIGAQFSLAFSIGLHVVEGRNDLDSYLDAQRWASPEILAVADKVKPHAISFEPGASQLGATVEVVLRDGRTFQHHQSSPRGFCDNPASDGDLIQKFRGLVEDRIPHSKATEIEQCVRELEALKDGATLARLLAS